VRIFPTGHALDRAYPHRWGDWDVTFRVQDTHGTAVLDVSLLAGSPRTVIHAYTQEITINLPPDSQLETLACNPACGTSWRIKSPDTTYIMSAPPGTKNASSAPNNLHITLPSSSSLISLTTVAPHTEIGSYLAYVQEAPSATKTTYTVHQDSITTTFLFSHPTLMGILPHQQPYLENQPSNLIGTYTTLHGPINLYGGQEFSTKLNRPALVPGLPLSSQLIADTEFKTRIEKDVTETKNTGSDVYASAKEILRLAQLLELTQQLPDEVLKASAREKLEAQLINWCTYIPGEKSNYFAYDEKRGGIIAYPPAFGSGDYNDHHFHYGYFIHAASIAAKTNPAFAVSFSNCIQLLIEDIAAISPDNPTFPRLRSFDPYAGHSWANGLQATGDGNNQESTSEAIQAWYAISLWGKITNNPEVEERGLWLMAQEIASARTYWLNLPPAPSTLPPEFPHPMASIIWGGKTDYQTFFDPSPAAIHGIQFFPATSALLAMVDLPVVEKIIDPILINDPTNSIWKDTLKTAAKLQHPDSENTFSSESLDPVYSSAYLHNWHTVLQEWGALLAASPQPCGYTFGRDSRIIAVIYRFAQDETSCTIRHPRAPSVVTLDNLTPGWNIREIEG
jgi:endoglucanase Acf2